MDKDQIAPTVAAAPLQDAAPHAAAPAPAVATDPAALQRAGSAAVSRMAATPPTTTAPAPAAASGAHGINSTVSTFYTVPQSAEAKVISVDAANHPSFSVDFHVALSQLEVPDIGLAELQKVTQVNVTGGAGAKAAVHHTLAGDDLAIGIVGVSAPSAVNATVFQLVLASGHSVTLTVAVPSFHTDIVEWQRAGLRQAMKDEQETVDTFQQFAVSDQGIADHPPAADVAKEDADLATRLAAIDGVNQQIAARAGALRADWQAVGAAQSGYTVEAFGGELAPQGKQLEALATQRTQAKSQLDSAQATATQLHGALDGMDGAPPDMVAQMQANDARATQLTAQLGALDQQIAAAKTALLAALDARTDLFQHVLAGTESLLETHTGQPLPAGAPTLGELMGQARVVTLQIQTLRATIADKLAEPAKVAMAAKARAGRDQATVAETQQRIAETQKQLAALVAPVYVTLGTDGNLVLPPAAPAKS